MLGSDEYMTLNVIYDTNYPVKTKQTLKIKGFNTI